MEGIHPFFRSIGNIDVDKIIKRKFPKVPRFSEFYKVFLELDIYLKQETQQSLKNLSSWLNVISSEFPSFEDGSADCVSVTVEIFEELQLDPESPYNENAKYFCIFMLEVSKSVPL